MKVNELDKNEIKISGIKRIKSICTLSIIVEQKNLEDIIEKFWLKEIVSVVM